MPLLIDVLATAGGSAVTAFKGSLPKLSVWPVNFGSGSNYQDRTGRLAMSNLRAEAYWRLKEALDPAMGSKLALPPDNDLKTEICSVRWKPSGGRVQLEKKEEIIKRIGRSPDTRLRTAASLLIADRCRL